jgi:hypothetical protein
MWARLTAMPTMAMSRMAHKNSAMNLATGFTGGSSRRCQGLGVWPAGTSLEDGLFFLDVSVPGGAAAVWANGGELPRCARVVAAFAAVSIQHVVDRVCRS